MTVADDRYVDWKHSAFLSPPNVIIGCDYSGVVAALGDDLKNSEWKVGDHVAGMVHGGKFTDKGSFASKRDSERNTREDANLPSQNTPEYKATSCGESLPPAPSVFEKPQHTA